MSTESSNSATPPAAAPPATTPPTSPPSLVGGPPADAAPVAWAEFVPDTTKSADENAAAKTAHDATKPAEVKPAAAPVVLTSADIKLPEGFQIDEPVMGEFLGLLNDDKLTPNERAQKLVDLQIKSAEAAREGASSAWETMMGTWQDEVRNDQVVGGAKFDQSIATANKVVNQFGSPELAHLAATTGIGNNVHFVRFLNSIAPKLLEAAPINPGGPAGGSDNGAASRMFPTMKK